MPRGLHNWNYKQVTAFLKKHGFVIRRKLTGSHELWVKSGSRTTKERVVNVNFHHGSYPVPTLKTMIIQSGIPAKEWIKWTRS